MSDEEIGDQLSMVPVYGINEGNKRKSNLEYFFSKSDAMEFSESEFIRSSFPLWDNFVVSEALDNVMDYHTEEGTVRLIPEAYEVKNALQVKKKAGLPDDTFSGIPVFESRNLSICEHYLRLTNEGCLNQRRPVFFKKEDLEKSLAKARAASHDERSNLIDTEAHIEVAALEDIIQAMKDDSTSEWNNVFFAYPGEDIRTGPSSPNSKKGRM
ncbi:protein TIC [Forsythia ovata]|uniref:Protein TIC n=1 Tax=Forsythia ovata TaxID=205694 RepID=A0ABD1RSF5_9LAMI